MVIRGELPWPASGSSQAVSLIILRARRASSVSGLFVLFPKRLSVTPNFVFIRFFGIMHALLEVLWLGGQIWLTNMVKVDAQ